MSSIYTLLELDGINFGDYAVRALTMTLQPIDSADLRRTINGTLRDFTSPQHRKYAVSISCEDVDAPDLAGIWRGMPVTVTCIPALSGASENPTAALVLDCLVDSWSSERQEWEDVSTWSISLLEI